MTGTFAGALRARGIQVAPGELTSTVEGDIEKTEHTIKISEIRVTYHVAIPADKKEEAERALQVHPKGCPAHESVKEGIRIKIDADFSEK
ncbi:MAG: OsmC family protein [SAR324 cluster bacterium]|nr:OsmC family protein [SAR324 cluster bacterium]